MSSLFGKPKMPDIPKQEAKVEDIKRVTEDAEVSRRKERKKILTGGRGRTIISGIYSALKKRLGE